MAEELTEDEIMAFLKIGGPEKLDMSAHRIRKILAEEKEPEAEFGDGEVKLYEYSGAWSVEVRDRRQSWGKAGDKRDEKKGELFYLLGEGHEFDDIIDVVYPTHFGTSTRSLYHLTNNGTVDEELRPAFRELGEKFLGEDYDLSEYEKRLED